LSADSLDTDVNHVIVDHKGNTIVAIIDSIDLDHVYYKSKNSSETSTMDIDRVYFIYNDYDRIYHYDWSYYENLRRITNRTGKIITLDNDSISFNNIEFSANRIFPEILVHGTNDTSFYMPALDVYKIQTDYSIMHYAAERGFWYSFTSFILSAAIETRQKWDKNRRFSPQVWDQYNDLLPAINFLDRKPTGVTYASVSYIIPLSVVGSMLWDIYKDKRSFYFHPLEKDTQYPRTMYVFSPRHIVESFIQKTLVRVERSKIGKYIFPKIRKKFN
jgi:hypothetical protein